MTTAITTNTIQQVDEYLEVNAEIAQLKKKQDKIKADLRKEMDNTGYSELHGTQGIVYLNPAKASNSTPRYNEFELNDIMTVLEGKDLKKVTEIRVNADKVKILMNEGGTVLKHKLEAIRQVRDGTARFTVKRN